jgi:hypothetical protein
MKYAAERSAGPLELEVTQLSGGPTPRTESRKVLAAAMPAGVLIFLMLLVLGAIAYVVLQLVFSLR